MSAAPESIVSDVKDLVSSCMADGKLDSGEILKIGMFAAEKVSQLKALSEGEKKSLVVSVVEKALKAVLPPEKYEEVGSVFALQVLPVVLDIAVGAAKGQFSLDAAKKMSAADWLACLVPCLKKVEETVVVSPAPTPQKPVSALVAPPLPTSPKSEVSPQSVELEPSQP